MSNLECKIRVTIQCKECGKVFNEGFAVFDGELSESDANMIRCDINPWMNQKNYDTAHECLKQEVVIDE